MADPQNLSYEVMRNGFRIKVLEDSHTRIEAVTEDIRKDFDKMEDRLLSIEKLFVKWTAAAEATEKHAKDIANKAITVKQFYVGVAAVIVAVLALVATLVGVK